MGAADSLGVQAFAESVGADLDLLANHLERLDDDALVIVMGDHQPPLLGRYTESFDVPVTFLTRSPSLGAALASVGLDPCPPLDPCGGSLRHSDIAGRVVEVLRRLQPVEAP